MASPANPSHPLTPPAEPSSQAPPTLPQSQSNPTTAVEALLSQPSTSLTDDGKQRRPRDHRLIHLLLASHGVAAYQERVPLQLMDFAYRYTNSILSDALHIQSEGYDQAEGGGAPTAKGRGGANKNQNKSEEGDVNLASLRLAIGSRMSHQYQGAMPKEFLKGLAEERNRIGLGVGGEKSGVVMGGVRLPSERYCLTGVGWGLKEEWDSEGEESVDDEDERGGEDFMQIDGDGPNEIGEENRDEDDEGMGTMEDVFGAEGDGDGREEGDQEMEDS